MPGRIFSNETTIISMGGERKAPEAPLIRFYYDKPTLKDMD
jgi:hypothetical protein